MGSNLSAAQRDDLARRNAAHEPLYSMVISEADAHELAAGRLPAIVQSMASWLTESVEETLTRKGRR